jgi:hypothetical protein
MLHALLIASTASLALQAGATPVVVELFTSQGCSACPPAEALLAEVARQPDVLALAFHVDYFDDRNWKDRFAIPEAVQRQRGYLRKLSRSGAFIPQAVVSGDTSFLGGDRRAMNRALAENRDALAVALARVDTQLQIDLTERWHEPMDVYLISYLSKATTRVNRRESTTRLLQEVNIVRSFKRLATWNGTPQMMKVPLASVPPDATAVAVVLQRPRQGAITGAATLALH